VIAPFGGNVVFSAVSKVDHIKCFRCSLVGSWLDVAKLLGGLDNHWLSWGGLDINFECREGGVYFCLFKVALLKELYIPILCC
jgi:hypothetical protein